MKPSLEICLSPLESTRIYHWRRKFKNSGSLQTTSHNPMNRQGGVSLHCRGVRGSVGLSRCTGSRAWPVARGRGSLGGAWTPESGHSVSSPPGTFVSLGPGWVFRWCEVCVLLPSTLCFCEQQNGRTQAGFPCRPPPACMSSVRNERLTYGDFSPPGQ